jgi:hypothetical protein
MTLVHIPIYRKDPGLPGWVRRFVFMELWRHTGSAICATCGASEGHCSNTYCERTRLTNMLHLYRKWDS